MTQFLKEFLDGTEVKVAASDAQNASISLDHPMATLQLDYDLSEQPNVELMEDILRSFR